jgi:hypothetical protein
VQVYSADTWRSTAILLDAARIGIADGGPRTDLAAHAYVAMGDCLHSMWRRSLRRCKPSLRNFADAPGNVGTGRQAYADLTFNAPLDRPSPVIRTNPNHAVSERLIPIL